MRLTRQSPFANEVQMMSGFAVWSQTAKPFFSCRKTRKGAFQMLRMMLISGGVMLLTVLAFILDEFLGMDPSLMLTVPMAVHNLSYILIGVFIVIVGIKTTRA